MVLSAAGRYAVAIVREKLAALDGKRLTFTATFLREGKKKAYRGYGFKRTVLLKNVRDKDGHIVTEHLWFNLTQAFEDAAMAEGDVIQFDARVGVYVKGHEKDTFDYKLSRPTRVINLGPEV